MRKTAVILLALTLASAASLARAQSAGPPPVIPLPKAGAAAPPAGARPVAPVVSRQDREVRCLLVMSAVAGNKERQQIGMLGVYFFTGRILQLNPNFDFVSGIRTVAAQMDQPTFRTEFQRCGAMVEGAAKRLQAAQQTLSPRSPPPAAGAAGAAKP